MNDAERAEQTAMSPIHDTAAASGEFPRPPETDNGLQHAATAT